MVFKTNEFKTRRSTKEQAQIEQLLSKISPIRVIQYIISPINTCKQKMIGFGKYNIKHSQRYMELLSSFSNIAIVRN